MMAGLAILASSIAWRQSARYELNSAGITARLDESGQMLISRIGAKQMDAPLTGWTELEGCKADGPVTLGNSAHGGGYTVARKLVNPSGNACLMTETFKPADGGIRWEVEIVGAGKPWSVPIQSVFRVPPAGVSFWVPWSDPRLSGRDAPKQNLDKLVNGIVTADADASWVDPLCDRPLPNDTLDYGSSPNNPVPFARNLLCIPMASLFWKEADAGLSIVLDPGDTILDMKLKLSSCGEVGIRRQYLRISNQHPVRFAANLVAHEADWRGGLRWMTRRYPEYFNPPNPAADDLAGTTAYSRSSSCQKLDTPKLKKMAFRTNWRASFDFPYMGMFLPPLGESEVWQGFGGAPTSMAAMNDYGRGMRDHGFYVLSYFNVAEFGAKVKWPLPQAPQVNERELWKDCNAYLSARLAPAILYGPYFSWNGCIVLDCGEPVYQEFLLEQARRNIEKLPATAGICVDRLDWLRLYNERRDDGVSWFKNKPARSLIVSWNRLMGRLGPLMHKAGKVIFVNNHTKRLDILRHADGIFDEFTYEASPLNTTALLCLRKPALGWTGKAQHLQPDPDKFFQKYLHMGVYPMAPYPGNDHALQPDPNVERYYLDYGPMLDSMRGKKWVLEPHCVEAAGGLAQVNLFEVPGGYVIPVTHGGQAESVEVVVRNVKGLTSKADCTALHPGSEQPASVRIAQDGGAVRLTVPLKRGCAMVKITIPSVQE